MSDKNFFKQIKCSIVKILLLIFFFNEIGFTKPIPPGSGAGDVPVNVLFLLDNSLSMRKQMIPGDGMYNPWDLVELDSGDLIISQQRRMGLVKINYGTVRRDGTFGNRGFFKGTRRDGECFNKNSTISNAWSLGIDRQDTDSNTDDRIYVADYRKNKIVIIDVDGNCLDVIFPGFSPRNLTVRTFGDETHLFAGGFKRRVGNSFYSANLSGTNGMPSGTSGLCSVSGNRVFAAQANGIAVDGSGGTPSNLYGVVNGHVVRFPLVKQGDRYCIQEPDITHAHDGGTSSTTRHPPSGQIEVDPSDDTLIYLATWTNQIAKYDITGTGNNGLTEVWKRGTRSRAITESDATVNFWGTRAIFVGEGDANTGNGNALVYVGSNKPSVQAFDKDHASGQWQKELGGSMGSRMDGAKKAIKAIVTDKTLTSGANFGYGHWSAGVVGVIGTRPAHRQQGNPDYYTGWSGDHPDGNSLPCSRRTCIRVGVGKASTNDIPDAVDRTPLVFGTDARAFSTMALDYFTDTTASPKTDGLDCQRNYVIVIGDGAWNGHDYAISKIEDLRTKHEVKTLVVAYGGGISSGGLDKFALMARAGSCNALGDDDCEPTILADTPTSLMTQLESKIQQLVADRLSFTAPSITATIEEGGSLYQAQFNYSQNEEWKGTIIRKSIDKHGKVCEPGPDDPCTKNWSAAERIDGHKEERFIWTVLKGADYVGNWNNWRADDEVDNSVAIGNLFGQLNYEVIDYHRRTVDSSGSAIQKYCYDLKNDSSIVDGNTDDIKGLINFVRGKDYFNYKKNCNLSDYRDHVLGDIYHSQIVQVGPAKASTSFVGINQESFWRASNNYGHYVNSHKNRPTILYAGANDGMLHAFKACEKDDEACEDGGKEEWAFVPPFIAAQLPTIASIGLNKEEKGGGSNSIFGVDGSPVVHDMYIESPHDSAITTMDDEGNETSSGGGKAWRTILVAPYGRGGAGFSVLDISDPLSISDSGPKHLFSIYNDTINNKVLVANHIGTIDEYPYLANSYALHESAEARRANDNVRTADDDTARDALAPCQSEADVTDQDFAINGDNACYAGKKWSWELPDHGETLVKADVTIEETTDTGTSTLDTGNYEVSDSGGFLTITFSTNKTYAAWTTDAVPTVSSAISIKLNREKLSTVDSEDDSGAKHYSGYSLLGETWSTPRIFRMPNPDESLTEIHNDIYVMVMGGGMGYGVGSNLFVIDLENQEHPGRILKVIDIPDDPDNGITNSTPGSPVVITPDTTIGIPWRGAIVYLNDLEGKITKFNLTNMKTDGLDPPSTVNLYDSTQIFNAGTNRVNGRYMYHSMDVSIGKDTKKLWLYAGTGDYEDVNNVGTGMDNVLLGIKDKAFPYYRNVTNTNITSLEKCEDTTNGASCPGYPEFGWRFHLSGATNTFEKVTAEPTVYKGNVYFPIYRPNTENQCDLGAAFICASDDECGDNISSELTGTGSDEFSSAACHFVGRGILSEIVVFADTLFANIAGIADGGSSTLVIRKAASGEPDSYRRSWRENY